MHEDEVSDPQMQRVTPVLLLLHSNEKTTPQRVATVASPMYMRSLMMDEHNMNSEVKPPRMMYTKCGLVIER